MRLASPGGHVALAAVPSRVAVSCLTAVHAEGTVFLPLRLRKQLREPRTRP